MPSPPAKPQRINESLFGHQEARILGFLAARLPAAVKPDHLTAIGVFGAFAVLAGYLLSRQSIGWIWLANAGLVIHWLGDSLDGNLARLRQIERPRYGFYLDQVIDTVGNLAIGIGVGLSPWVRLDGVLLTLVVYQMLTIQVLVRTIIDREFHLAVGRLGPTEMRLGIVAMNLGILLFGAPSLIDHPVKLTWADCLVVAAAVIMLVLFARQFVAHVKRIGREDPPLPSGDCIAAIGATTAFHPPSDTQERTHPPQAPGPLTARSCNIVTFE